MAKELTERQQALISNVLNPKFNGDIRQAMTDAGYSPNTSIPEAIKPIQDEIIDATKLMMAINAPKAATGMVHVLDNPSDLGAKNKLAAAEKILDRAGVTKAEEQDKAPTVQAIFVLPSKQEAVALPPVVNEIDSVAIPLDE